MYDWFYRKLPNRFLKWLCYFKVSSCERAPAGVSSPSLEREAAPPCSQPAGVNGLASSWEPSVCTRVSFSFSMCIASPVRPEILWGRGSASLASLSHGAWGLGFLLVDSLLPRGICRLSCKERRPASADAPRCLSGPRGRACPLEAARRHCREAGSFPFSLILPHCFSLAIRQSGPLCCCWVWAAPLCVKACLVAPGSGGRGRR